MNVIEPRGILGGNPVPVTETVSDAKASDIDRVIPGVSTK